MTQAISNADWTAPWLKSISTRLTNENKVSPTVISLSPLEGVTVNKDASDKDIQNAIHGLLDVKDRNRTFMTLLDRFIGQLIVAYSARHECEWSESISRLELIEHTGKAFKTLMKLPRIVTNLPDEAFTFKGLTTSHFDAATSFAGPKDNPEKAREWYDRRVEILREASVDPNEFGKAWVSEKMRALQAEFGVKPSRKAGADQIQRGYNIVTDALIEWNEEDYSTFGVTRGELLDRFREYKSELIDRGIHPEDNTDPLNFHLPWRTSNIIEVEAHESEQSEAAEPASGEETEEAA